MGKIRNLIQSQQEREVIKTAPDLVIYIEGLPYLQNAYLTSNPSNPFLVNFNNYVTTFTASYDLDQMIPSCSFTLNIPAHLRYLFQAPGGNNLIQTMMQVQVFTKGYYFATNGDTLFYRVFKGFTSHITHTDDGQALLISIQCQGILGFFGMMQIEQSPAAQSSSPSQMTPFQSIFAGMSAYQQIEALFLHTSFTDGFWSQSLGGDQSGATTIQQTPYFNAIEHGFIAKWQTILMDLCRETHIFGLQNKDIKDVASALLQIAKASPDKGDLGMSTAASQMSIASNVPESQQSQFVIDTPKIRALHPDFGIGTLELTNGRVISRLDFLRNITSAINYECFQDIDGQIIIKPPLYNLDVKNLGTQTPPPANPQYTQSHQNTDFTNANNPFIINLSEIISESETEDQAAIRYTRMTVQGDTTPQYQGIIQLGTQLRGVGAYVDLPKLAQFGLREEPPQTIHWVAYDDPLALFAIAASEMARRNRAFRTYTFEIPLRPELHLGFPVFIPHRDMYGYVKSVTINLQIGGTATMSVTLDALRKRPMFPQPNSTTGTSSGTVFVAQPNLVLKWTQGSTTATPEPGNATAPNPTASPADLTGSQVSVPLPPTAAAANPTPSQLAMVSFQQQALGSYFALSSDTKDASWRIQPDTASTWAAPNPSAGASSKFPRLVDNTYYYDLYHTSVPYTDEKGYEVLIPFPWGRWLDLKTMLQEVTRDGYVIPRPSGAGQSPDFTLVQAANTFLYAGLGGSGVTTGDASSKLSGALAQLQTTLGIAPNSGTTAPGTTVSPVPTGTTPSSTPGTLQDITVFALDYGKPPYNFSGANGIITVAQPDAQIDAVLIATTTASEQQKVNMFLTGATPTPDLTLASQVKAVGNTTLSAGQTPLQPGQFAVQP
jgi:hypothetical protein